MKLNSIINIYTYNNILHPAQRNSAPVFRGQAEEITKLESIKSNKLGVLKSIILHKKSSYETQEPVLDDNTYIIRMFRYKNKTSFAKKMNGLTYKISDMIKNNADFDEILKTAEDGVKDIRHRKGLYLLQIR